MKERRLPRVELEITYLKGSGPGGQNRNKRMTGVRAKDHVTGVVAMATERRSQAQNLSLAVERLYAKLEDYYHVPEERISTTRPIGSVLQRLSDKRQGSKKKQGRLKKFNFDE